MKIIEQLFIFLSFSIRSFPKTSGIFCTVEFNSEFMMILTALFRNIYIFNHFKRSIFPGLSILSDNIKNVFSIHCLRHRIQTVNFFCNYKWKATTGLEPVSTICSPLCNHSATSPILIKNSNIKYFNSLQEDIILCKPFLFLFFLNY